MKIFFKRELKQIILNSLELLLQFCQFEAFAIYGQQDLFIIITTFTSFNELYKNINYF